jgi:hypothetical protein
MVEPMDYVKFVCRDLWLLLFKKQADRLQTNHKVRVRWVSLLRALACAAYSIVLGVHPTLGPLTAALVEARRHPVRRQPDP